MNMTRWRTSVVRWLTAVITILLAGFWLWRCFASFPARGWNEVRLVPSFMWLNGISPYAPPGGGPVTTWIYGPLPFLIHMPAAIATNSGAALLISGAINIGVTVGVLAYICARWPLYGTGSQESRSIAFLVCLALWPATSFEFLQADNLGVSFALLSLYFIETRDRPHGLLLAALTCVGALGCKQTFCAVALAEIGYIGLRENFNAAFKYTLLVFFLTTVGCIAAGACFGFQGLYFSTIVLPALQPWTTSMADRLRELGPQLSIHLAGPVIIIILLARQTAHGKEAPWVLPLMAFLLSCVFDLPASFKDGGSINAIHGFLLFLPPALVVLLGSRSGPNWLRMAAVFGSVAALVLRNWIVHPPSIRPWVEHLRQGEFLARTLPGEIYFPWHPLVVYYAEHRFEHSEDGLFIRYMAGKPVVGAGLRAYLPNQMHAVAFLNNEIDWTIARSFIPPGTRPTAFRYWTIYIWDQNAPK